MSRCVTELRNNFYELRRISNDDFARLSKPDKIIGVPIYFTERQSGIIDVWPLPEGSIKVYKLVELKGE